MQVNIYENQFIADRIPTLSEEATDFEEIVDIFKHYGDNSDKGHLINFWSGNNKSKLSEFIDSTALIPLDFDVHKDFEDENHFLNSIKYIWTYKQVKRILDSANLNYIMYKTKSYSAHNQCFRVVLPLKNELKYSTMQNLREFLKYDNYYWKTLDPASLANQLFKLPFHPEGDEIKVEYNIDGEDFDILEENFLFPKYYQIEKAEPEEIFFEEGNFNDVSSSKAIKYYLETCFSKKSGNGNSSTSLFTALAIAKKNNDDETLQRIINKARSERWKTSEINQKLNSIK